MNGESVLVPSGERAGLIYTGKSFAAALSVGGHSHRRHRFQSDRKIEEWLDISDLGVVIRDGIAPPRMLLDCWLQPGALHWFQGKPADGKAWVTPWCCAQLIRG